MLLKNKTAVITGSSIGIGHAIATAFAAEGANVVVNYLKSKSEAQELVDHLNRIKASSAIAVCADVSDKNAVENMFKQAADTFGPVQILVNNAGQVLLPQFWREVDAETWRLNHDINLLGALFCIQTAVPQMEKAGYGRIINIASTYGMTGSPFVPAYTSSKAGLINLTYGLAKDLAPAITVNAIAPGNIDTAMTSSAGEEFVKQIIHNTPMKRLGHPAEIADAAVFLASNKASFITGHVLVVDGGFIL